MLSSTLFRRSTSCFLIYPVGRRHHFEKLVCPAYAQASYSVSCRLKQTFTIRLSLSASSHVRLYWLIKRTTLNRLLNSLEYTVWVLAHPFTQLRSVQTVIKVASKDSRCGCHLTASSQTEVRAIMNHRLQNAKLKNYTEERFRRQGRRWLQHSAISFIVPSHPLGRSRGP